jgi:hypothetical protein
MEPGRAQSRQFFALGGIYPRGWPERPSAMLAECLIEDASPQVDVEARFDQRVERRILDPEDEPIEELRVTGRRYSPGEEAQARDGRLSLLPDRKAILATAGSERMELIEAGIPAGSVLWLWEPLHATIEAWSEAIRPRLHRVRVAVTNRLEWDEEEGERNRLRILHSTQVVIESPDAVFASRVGQLSRLHDTPAAHPTIA